MTVSRVINGGRNVRPETRERVEAAIAELAYAPNAAARSLAAADSIRIGLIYSNPSAAYLSEFLLGGLDQASRANIQLVVEKCDPDGGEADTVARLVQQGMDGVILPAPLCDMASVHAVLLKAGVPSVSVASGVPSVELAAVSIDDRSAARTMTDHLVSLGHRRIGFVVGHPDQTASRARLDGYCEALTGHGIAIDDALIRPGLFTYRSGLEAAAALLALPQPPTAIFASNDDMAAAAVATAHRLHLDVPRDLTVVGFDDTALATTIWPELTTIRQPIADMARAAVKLLVAAVRDRRSGRPASPPHLLLDFTLVRRDSDAAPH